MLQELELQVKTQSPLIQTIAQKPKDPDEHAFCPRQKTTQANSGEPTVERKVVTEAAVKTSPPPLVASQPSVAEATNAPTTSDNKMVQRSNGPASSPPGAASESPMSFLAVKYLFKLTSATH